ncbi:MAG: metallophosphoesterase, partial [Propionibacteriaceae bacterium]|nr:metallophosphoesterase [Propionibacteriaceae bacterium]
MSGPTRFSPPPTLLTVLAGRSSTRPAKETLVHDVLRSLGLTVAAALLAAPFAIAWGVGHAEIDDYLGPHRANFASDYSGEVDIDLGPIGNAYLPSPWTPIGLKITVGGVGAVPGEPSLFSQQTLTTYAGIFAEPEEAVAGVVERLVRDVAAQALKAELVLLTLFAGWTLRRQVLAPRLARPVSLRRAGTVYAASLGLLFSSIMGPPAPSQGTRLPVTVDLGSSFRGLSVDSLLLSDLLDRGIKGITLLTDRQRRAVDSYIADAAAAMLLQYSDLPKPRAHETMLLGFSDLHCNQAMTELIRRMAVITQPAQVLSSGDDTVNGTAVERFCITREAKIAEGVPFVVAPGNHDSDITESQMRSAKMTVLDGKTIDSSGLSIVGEDDPEHN